MTGRLSQGEHRSIHDPIETLEQDILGRQALAQTILDRLCNSDASVFGIYGGWGTGKTSLLNLMDQLNDERRHSHQSTLYIEIVDAWKYEELGSLLIPIVVLLREMSGDGGLPDSWRVITRRILATAALSLADAGLRKMSNLSIQDLKDTYQQAETRDSQKDHAAILLEWENWSDDIKNTERAFQTIIAAVLAAKGCSRIVLCIDNLDRCSPENAISLLESVKNFLTVPGCAWVFAMDSDVIASYINKKYEGTTVNGYSFLDKIIPEQYHLSLSPSREDRSIIFNFIYSATGSQTTLDDPSRLPQIPRVIVPRRLIKSALKFSEFFDKTTFDAGHDTVFLLILLYHSWPDFYEMLSSPSTHHIGRILANFYKENEKTWGKFEPVPLEDKISNNQELKYFLRQAFPSYSPTLAEPEILVDEIRSALEGLKRTGLP